MIFFIEDLFCIFSKEQMIRKIKQKFLEIKMKYNID